MRLNSEIGRAFIAVILLAVAVLAGYGLGQQRERSRGDARVEAEYVRVVSAIARTMRCSTEEEFAQGEDHECDPSEVEQDACLIE